MLKLQTVEEFGVVKSTEGLIAKVTVPRKNVCEGCTAGMCKPDEQSMELEALNPVGAIAGQRVRVVMKPYTYLKGTVIVYGIPALALVAGTIFGKKVLSSYFKEFDPDTVSAIAGFCAFIVSFLFLKIWSKRVEKGERADLKPVIVEILE